MLKIGSTFYWISPLFAFFEDATNGPSDTFLIPDDSGWSGREIERMLRQSGVGTWGLMIVDDTLMVSVRACEAAWAQSLLSKNGVPIEGPMVDSVHQSDEHDGLRQHRTPKQRMVANANK